ncbi:hypothetical protein DIPPA_15268 [Diplonema papillatum]|nr:hypothetical protein DIPPA_15268 [Diplonema papillatum]
MEQLLRALEPVFEYLAHPDDDDVQVIRKKVITPVLVLLWVSATVVTLALAAMGDVGPYFIAAMNGVVVTTVTGAVILASKRVPDYLIAWCLVGGFITVVVVDYPAAANSGYRAWPFLVLVADIVPICRAPHSMAYALIAGSIVWVALVQTEATFRFGWFDLDSDFFVIDNDTRAAVCECGAPPCPISGKNSLVASLAMALVLGANYLFVRNFAVQAIRQQEVLFQSVAAAREISELLVRFNLADAEASLAMNERTIDEEFHSVLQALLSNLKIYEPFLPQSCLPYSRDESDDEDNNDTTDDDTSITIMESPMVDSKIRGVPGISTNSSAGSTNTITTSRGASYLTRADMLRKNVTIMALNVRNSLSLTKEAKGSAFGDMQRGLLTLSLRVVAETKGIVESFMGDRIVSSWNASRNCVNSRYMASEAACKIDKSAAGNRIFTHCAIAAGEALCGNAGTDALMRYNIVGGVYPYALELMKVARDWCVPVITDSRVQRDIAESHKTRVVLERVRFPKRGSTDQVLLWEILESNAQVDEEWMYVVESTANRKNALVNDLAIAFLQGKEEMAANLRKQLTPTPDDPLDPFVMHLTSCMDGNAPSVVTLLPVPTPRQYPSKY